MQVNWLSTHNQVRWSLNGYLRHISCLDSLAVNCRKMSKMECLGSITSVLDGKARHSQGGIRSECQEEAVAAALHSLRGLGSLKTG